MNNNDNEIIETSYSGVEFTLLCEFLQRHSYCTCMSSEALQRFYEFAAAGASNERLAAIIWVATDPRYLDANIVDYPVYMQTGFIISQLERELSSEWRVNEARRLAREKEMPLIKRIVEVAAWSAGISQRATVENVNLVEVVGNDELVESASFTINGFGYKIDFINHLASRITDLDTH